KVQVGHVCSHETDHTVSSDELQVPRNYHGVFSRIIDLVTFDQVPGKNVFNPARSDPSAFVAAPDPENRNTMVICSRVASGDPRPAGLVAFAFVFHSMVPTLNIINTNNVQYQNQEIAGAPITDVAEMSDDDTFFVPNSSAWDNNEDLVRHQIHYGIDPVLIWDCSAYFKTGPEVPAFDNNHFLTEIGAGLPQNTKEIPNGAFCAIHFLGISYRKGTSTPTVTMNLTGIQILAIPN
ncbi:hypothetical protein DENSPDRAFT_855662, partial [Dentipellis sp. KUC8613]